MANEIVIHQTKDGKTKIDVKFENETVWLSQAQLCDLYQTSKSNISEHIKHIFEEGELSENSVVRNFRTTGADVDDERLKELGSGDYWLFFHTTHNPRPRNFFKTANAFSLALISRAL